MIYIDNKESIPCIAYFYIKYSLHGVYVIVPERSKGTDLRSVVHKHAWVRTPPMTSMFTLLYLKLVLFI